MGIKGDSGMGNIEMNAQGTSQTSPKLRSIDKQIDQDHFQPKKISQTNVV